MIAETDSWHRSFAGFSANSSAGDIVGPRTTAVGSLPNFP